MCIEKIKFYVERNIQMCVFLGGEGGILSFQGSRDRKEHDTKTPNNKQTSCQI